MMKRSIFKLGSLFSKNQQKTINGGMFENSSIFSPCWNNKATCEFILASATININGSQPVGCEPCTTHSVTY